MKINPSISILIFVMSFLLIAGIVSTYNQTATKNELKEYLEDNPDCQFTENRAGDITPSKECYEKYLKDQEKNEKD